MKERFKRDVKMDKISLKVQWVSPSTNPDHTNKNFKLMRKDLKCSWWRLHFLKVIPEDHKLIKTCREKTISHHKLSVGRFRSLKKYYCQKCQAVFYKEEWERMQ